MKTKAMPKKLKALDSGLEPYWEKIAQRMARLEQKRKRLYGSKKPEEFANGYLYFGFHRTEEGWVFREWLPGAEAVWFYGDFNGWNPSSHPLKKKKNGVWELSLCGRDALVHGQFVKLLVQSEGKCRERIPAYIRRAVQDERTYRFCGQIWDGGAYPWTDASWREKRDRRAPLIYEAHVGMAQEKEGIGSYREFADLTLERIAAAGYNTVQLMAVQEHPYYASFGYQVSNFFAPSSRFGTPEDLKYLINKAHGLGIAVLLDVVHSHACANEGEGLSHQDGGADSYFLSGERGWHEAWGTRLFDYGRGEVLHFLLSNLKYWMEEFHFDGFRFDGVTSMLYENHGLGVAFTDYSQYYGENTNTDAVIYLTLANELVHRVDPNAVTVAEDMSGMPGACLPRSKGGMGFDYRLAMGVPDLWIRLIKEKKIEEWSVGQLWYELTCGREGEGSVGYCESHDQAMVGDKTIIFRLADAAMYTGMSRLFPDPVAQAAVEMHKLIRLLTASLAKDGYLNFMGNEFGHPEWIDFPREGNGWSYRYARRQWSLAEDGLLMYGDLARFDRKMIALLAEERLLEKKQARPLWLDEEKKLMVFVRGEFLFAFNLHPLRSWENVFVSCEATGEGAYEVVLSSDESAFAGQERIDKDYVYFTEKRSYGVGFGVYLPCRTAVVLKKKKGKEK